MALKRITIIQKVIDYIGAKTYLEIGTCRGDTLIWAKAERKMAVDVKFQVPFKYRIRSFWNTTYRKMTSDDYFKKYKNVRFDVAFIDGMHTHEQSLKDVENCLKFVSQGGVILMHDCNPLSEKAASPDPLPKGTWNGGVWKTIVALRTRVDLEAFVLDADQGVGIIRKGNPESTLNFSHDEILKLAYSDLEKNRESFLNLKPPGYFPEFLKTIRKI